MATIDLQFNYPILGTEASLLAAYVRGIDAKAAVGLLSSRFGAGQPEHREAAANFLRGYGLHVADERVFLVSGGHFALTLAISLARLNGQRVAVDTLTYSNFLGIAATHAMEPLPCATDADGMTPDALLFAVQHGARAVYLMPTVHNPLGTVMPLARRKALADIAEANGLWVLEDDAYAFLEPSPPRTFASLLPEQTFHVYSFSKPFAPLLKAAILTVPMAHAEEVEQAVVLGGSTSLFFAAFMTHLLKTGAMEAVVQGKREEAATRQRLARTLLQHCTITAHPASYHQWVAPEHISAKALCVQAAERGVLLSTGAFFVPAGLPTPNAFRLALGGETDRGTLERGLELVGKLLAGK